METKIKVYEDDLGSYIGLRIWKRDQYVQKPMVQLLTSLAWSDYDMNDAYYAPSSPLTIDRQEAQSLMDQLWTLGFRPKEGVGSVGQLAATEKHLVEISGYAQKFFHIVENHLLSHPLSPIIGEMIKSGRK